MLALLLSHILKFKRLWFLSTFILFYLVFNLAITPAIAPLFGRTALPWYGNLRPLNILTCLFNRHYVTAELKEELGAIAQLMNSEFPGTKTNYLDANFPFIDGFPLFPHLSHNDGQKVDLAFYYVDSNSENRSNSAPSFIGYGIYDGPKEGEVNYPERCAKSGHWQYGLMGKVVPNWHKKDFKVDIDRTRRIMDLLANSHAISKIFIEPHLKSRWKLQHHKVRFHGCWAVRHDDHIHVQTR